MTYDIHGAYVYTQREHNARRKHMRHIVTNPYHFWAHQTQDWAANSSRNCSFEGVSAYSYRAEIARIVTNERGQRAYLVSTRKWSVTTSRHQSDVRYAIPDSETVFSVYDVSESPLRQLEVMLAEIREVAGKAQRARSNKQWLELKAQNLCAEANEFAKFFALEVEIPTPAMAAEALAHMRREEERKLHEAHERARRAAEESIAAWVAGDPHAHIPYGVREAYCRVSGDVIQTSKGADVPLTHARRALPLIVGYLEDGREYSRTEASTVRLGLYTLDRINEDGVFIGCHWFTPAEVRRIAAVISQDALCFAEVC